MGEMRSLCEQGDVKITWNPSVPEEVDRARRMFDDLKKKGHLFFRIKPSESLSPGAEPAEERERVAQFKRAHGELIVEFDPKAEKIVDTPAVAGG